MFKNATAAYRVLDGPIGNELFSSFEAKGITGLLWAGLGFKEVETTNRVIRVPEDMRGLRLRIQEVVNARGWRWARFR